MADDRAEMQQNRSFGLKARHETREERFHERVRDVLGEGIAGKYWAQGCSPRHFEIAADVAEAVAPAAYQALLDAGFVVIPAAEETS